MEVVATRLLEKVAVNLSELSRSVDLPHSVVKQCLLVLLQHNFVNVFLVPEEEGSNSVKPASYIYEASLNTILQTTRHPRFLLHISEELGENGEVAEAIVEALLENGRLTLQQVQGAVESKMKAQQHQEAQNSDTTSGGAPSSEMILNVFMSLVQSHYLERVPPCNLPPPQRLPHPNSVKTRRSAKAGNESYAQQQSEALKRMDEVAYDNQRFKIPTELLLDDWEDLGGQLEANGDPMKGEAEGASGVKRPYLDLLQGLDVDLGVDSDMPSGKRQKRSENGGAEPVEAQPGLPSANGKSTMNCGPSSSSSSSSHVLWRVNHEEFNRRFRHQCCVTMVADKINRDAGTVVAGMLNHSRPFETKLTDERSVHMGEQEVHGTISRLICTGVLQPLEADTSSILQTIANDSLEMISEVGTGPSGRIYCVNMQRIMDLLRLKQLEAVVKERFSVPGLRIFRLLLLRGQLEQKQIADFGMFPQKETRELLYRMMKGGFIMLQDIPKTNDRAPARSFYTWRVNIQAATERLGVELYRAAGNMRARLAHEMGRMKDLLELIERARAEGGLKHSFTKTQRQQLERLQRVTQTLEVSLLRVDEMSALFNEY